MLHEQVHCRDETANHRLLIAVALLNHPNSFRGGMFKLNAKLDAYSLLYLLSHFEFGLQIFASSVSQSTVKLNSPFGQHKMAFSSFQLYKD